LYTHRHKGVTANNKETCVYVNIISTDPQNLEKEIIKKCGGKEKMEKTGVDMYACTLSIPNYMSF
jgi:hypothetical protein